jgi:hypothetical protein
LLYLSDEISQNGPEDRSAKSYKEKTVVPHPWMSMQAIIESPTRDCESRMGDVRMNQQGQIKISLFLEKQK